MIEIEKLIYDYIRNHYSYNTKNECYGWIYNEIEILKALKISKEELSPILTSLENKHMIRKEWLGTVYKPNFTNEVSSTIYGFFII